MSLREWVVLSTLLAIWAVGAFVVFQHPVQAQPGGCPTNWQQPGRGGTHGERDVGAIHWIGRDNFPGSTCVLYGHVVLQGARQSPPRPATCAGIALSFDGALSTLSVPTGPIEGPEFCAHPE